MEGKKVREEKKYTSGAVCIHSLLDCWTGQKGNNVHTTPSLCSCPFPDWDIKIVQFGMHVSLLVTCLLSIPHHLKHLRRWLCCWEGASLGFSQQHKNTFPDCKMQAEVVLTLWSPLGIAFGDCKILLWVSAASSLQWSHSFLIFHFPRWRNSRLHSAISCSPSSWTCLWASR